MKKKYPLLFKILFLIVSITFSCCSKSDDGIVKTEPVELLSAEKENYAPYEVVQISASRDLFTMQSFNAKINGVDVALVASEDKATFVLPNLTNGNYNLTFTINNKNYQVPLTVTSLSNVFSANQYFNELKAAINQNITNLNSQITQLKQNSSNPIEYENLENDVIKYTTLLNDYTITYNNLSELDKVEFAKTIAANKVLFESYDNLNEEFQSNTVSLRKSQTMSIKDYEAEVETATEAYFKSVDEMARLIPKIAGFAIVAYTPIHPIINAGAILATGILVAKFMINVNKTISAAITLTNKSIKPFEFNSQTTQTIYGNGTETVSDIQAKYRSLINSDVTNSGSTIIKIIEKFNNLIDIYNNFRSELPAIFRPSYIMNSLKNTYKTISRSINNKYISIANVSNPNVTLQQLNQPDGSVKIKATTTSKTDQTFTYDINYTNSRFTNGLNQTVSAKVVTAPLLTGIWELESFENGIPAGQFQDIYYQGCSILAEKFSVIKSTIEFKESSYTENSWTKIINFNKVVQQPCNLLSDDVDTEKEYYDLDNGKYILTGDVLKITDQYNNVREYKIIFITDKKIKRDDSVYVRKL